CRFICPLGAIYSLFCKISMLGVKLDKDKCIDCGLCVQGCKMDIKHVGDHECIQCGECISVCPVQAISWKGSKIFLKNTTPINQPAVAEGEKLPLLELAKTNANATVSSATATGSATATMTEVKNETAVTQEIEKVDTQPEQKPKGQKLQAVKAAFKKPRFIVEFVAWIVALAVLIAALVCYNLPEKKSAVLPAFTVTTYKSAASEGGEEYSTVSEGNSRVKVLYFWRTDLEDSVEAMEELNELAALYNRLDFADVVAIHSIYKDNRDVQAFIDEHGWNDYNIIFAQDDMETNAYGLVGGDISVPKPITAVISADREIVLQTQRVPDATEIQNAVAAAQSGKVFGEGEMCPLFVLDRYNAEEGAKFSVLESRGKVTVINFWYTKCDPCKDELPEFEAVYEE
ncbi:MAG: redoxin domain-containing protein, partial [Clostridia bacterium]|nr:redoxin domain-containing protein [Clostridia bacterium]